MTQEAVDGATQLLFEAASRLLETSIHFVQSALLVSEGLSAAPRAAAARNFKPIKSFSKRLDVTVDAHLKFAVY
jgi:hypothetical protein